MYVWSMKNDVVPSFVSQGINEFAVPFVFIKIPVIADVFLATVAVVSLTPVPATNYDVITPWLQPSCQVAMPGQVGYGN